MGEINVVPGIQGRESGNRNDQVASRRQVPAHDLGQKSIVLLDMLQHIHQENQIVAPQRQIPLGTVVNNLFILASEGIHLLFRQVDVYTVYKLVVGTTGQFLAYETFPAPNIENPIYPQAFGDGPDHGLDRVHPGQLPRMSLRRTVNSFS